jgi:hypothetical protein
MIFADLCAKDNGTAYKSFGLYTFIKYNKYISTFLSTRLFNAMLCSSEPLQNKNEQFKEFDNIPRLKRRISRENFVKTFSTIYFGSEED